MVELVQVVTVLQQFLVSLVIFTIIHHNYLLIIVQLKQNVITMM